MLSFREVLLVFIFGQYSYAKLCRPLDCDSIDEDDELQLCKISSDQKLSVTVQPTITVLEVLEFNEKENSFSIALQIKLAWNNSRITEKGSNTSSLCSTVIGDWFEIG